MKSSKRSRPRLIRILFIGNSFTARNNLPGLIAQLAAARGHHLEHRLISVGGASLRTHWNAGNALDEIRNGHYDYVVLQEQSTLPIKNPTRMHENVQLFDEAIKASGAKTVLYMTWARKHAPETQANIADAYNQIGKKVGAIVVPVGIAWKAFQAKHERPVLHDKDQSHPTLAGSYLAACVFLITLLDENPIGAANTVDGLDEQGVGLIQKRAWEITAALKD